VVAHSVRNTLSSPKLGGEPTIGVISPWTAPPLSKAPLRWERIVPKARERPVVTTPDIATTCCDPTGTRRTNSPTAPRVPIPMEIGLDLRVHLTTGSHVVTSNWHAKANSNCNHRTHPPTVGWPPGSTGRAQTSGVCVSLTMTIFGL